MGPDSRAPSRASRTGKLNPLRPEKLTAEAPSPGPSPAIRVEIGHSRAREPAAALRELETKVTFGGASLVLVFASPTYDLDRLSDLLLDRVEGPLAGCTTAGNIGPGGYEKSGLTAVSIASPRLSARVHRLQRLTEPSAEALCLADEMSGTVLAPGYKRVGLTFLDGLAIAEERVASALYRTLDFPIVGGSAGDDQRFARTHVLGDEGFVADEGVFVEIATSLPFRTFKAQHFSPTERRVIVTAAEPRTRRVYELDGRPAAEVYAELVGVLPALLASDVFSLHPLTMNLGGEHYVHGIQRAHEDRSLTFFVGLSEGAVLRLGRASDPVRALRHALDGDAEARPALTIGIDCVLRHLELEQTGLVKEVNGLLVERPMIGFRSYGAQHNGTHTSHTMTGLTIYEPLGEGLHG